jgi:Protein of unknown function (DUF4065)
MTLKTRLSMLILYSMLTMRILLMVYAAPQTKIRFWFQVQKAIEASAKILERHDKGSNGIEYISLLRILYLCDRDSLDQTERTISGGSYVVLKDSLVLGNVQALIQEKAPEDEMTLWNEFFLFKRGNVSLVTDKHPGCGNLCRKDMKIIENVYDSCGHLDPNDASLWTSKTPEWKPGISEISVEEVLDTLGKDDAAILRIKEMDLAAQYFDKI